MPFFGAAAGQQRYSDSYSGGNIGRSGSKNRQFTLKRKCDTLFLAAFCKSVAGKREICAEKGKWVRNK